ncbi:MAG: MFS transporter [FCB group bacterium]|jgi:MFS family permease|nr:MFS transporter [FCB group bacterium]
MSTHDLITLPWRPRAKDFEQRSIAEGELPTVMRRHIFTGAMGGAYGLLTTHIFFVAFGNALGVTVFQWGLYGAITTFALAFQLLSAHWAAQLGQRKLLWWATETLSRVLKAIGLVTAFVFYTQGNLPAAAFSLIFWLCMSGVLAAMSQPIWFSWLADIIPAPIHGRFMGRRDVWVSLFIVALAVPAGWASDAFAGDAKTAVLMTILMAGIALGMMDVSIHRTIPEPPMAPDRETTFRERILTPLRDRNYRPWLLFAGAWNFAAFLGNTLANVYFIDHLGLSKDFLGGAVVLIAVPLLAIAVTSRWSGVLVDRLGVRRMLAVSHLCWAVVPIFWVVATPRTALFWLTVSMVISGAATSPAVNAANKLITRTPPRHLRAMYMAMSTCVGALAGGFGALSGGIFLTWFGDLEWILGGVTFVSFHLLFLASLVLRVASWTLLLRIKTPEFDRLPVNIVPDEAPVYIPSEASPEKAA